MMRLMAILAGGALATAGCASSSGTQATRDLAANLASDARVTAVRVADGGPGSPVFREMFKLRVQERLDGCAHGTTPLTAEVTIDTFQPANVVVAALIPAQSRIAGTTRLIDADGELVAQYRIQRSLTAGGVVGATLAATAETQMSHAFGDELCKQAFPAE